MSCSVSSYVSACADYRFFFFKQKTAYEMRISDWSSDVCSSDLLDGQAALEVGRRLFPLLEIGLLAGDERGDESLVLRLVERAVHVVGGAAAGAGLVVARLHPGLGEVDRLLVDDGRDGIEIGRALGRERVGQYV